MNATLPTTHRTIDPSNLSPKSRRAVAKYGYANCVLAYNRNVFHGEGPSTIAETTDGLSNVASAFAAIDAGREIETGIQNCEFEDVVGDYKVGNTHQSRKTLGKMIEGKNVSVRFMLGTPGRVTVSVTYAMWTNWIGTLSAPQFDAFVRSLPEGTEVSKF